MSGGVDYFTHCASSGAHDLYSGENETPEEGYLTDMISKRAVDYVERMAPGSAQGTPFFLSLHYTAPHWPWETREDHAKAAEVKDNLFHLDGGNIHTYHRMIHHMDEGIGWVMDALKKTGQLDNTLIVFTSDNGGERFSDNWPLVGGKMDLTEGGIRVPWIAHWPAVIAPGGTSTQHCMTMDWSATMVELAGAEAHADHPFDGVSMAPVLRDAKHQFDRPLYWRMNHRGQRALRMGDYKYLRVDGNDYLFNIPADERERANIAKREPERLDVMRQAWEAWDKTVPAIPEDATISLGYSVKDMPQR
jgi:arylsulfatase A-like enzyme